MVHLDSRHSAKVRGTTRGPSHTLRAQRAWGPTVATKAPCNQARPSPPLLPVRSCPSLYSGCPLVQHRELRSPCLPFLSLQSPQGYKPPGQRVSASDSKLGRYGLASWLCHSLAVPPPLRSQGLLLRLHDTSPHAFAVLTSKPYHTRQGS